MPGIQSLWVSKNERLSPPKAGASAGGRRKDICFQTDQIPMLTGLLKYPVVEIRLWHVL